MLPDFIGIGAPKAGTTWLFECLRDHPGVYVPECKETNFFDYGTIEGRMDEYLIHFRDAPAGTAVGEISTRYLASRAAPRRIRDLVPQAKLFVSLRDPAGQVQSHYWHLRRQNFHDWNPPPRPPTLEEALERYPEKLVTPVLYAAHLRRWLAEFPREQLHIILYDDVRADPLRVVRELYRFLGVDETFVPPAHSLRATRTRSGVSPRSEALGRMYQRIYSAINRRVYHPLKTTLGLTRALRLKERLRARQIMERAFMRSGYPPLPAAERNALIARFQPEIDQLEELIGLDLAAWKQHR